MKNNLLKASIITANVICLLISLRIFYACGIFADEHNLSTESVFGGSFWLILNWISFASLLINVFLLAFANKEKRAFTAFILLFNVIQLLIICKIYLNNVNFVNIYNLSIIELCGGYILHICTLLRFPLLIFCIVFLSRLSYLSYKR